MVSGADPIVTVLASPTTDQNISDAAQSSQDDLDAGDAAPYRAALHRPVVESAARRGNLGSGEAAPHRDDLGAGDATL